MEFNASNWPHKWFGLWEEYGHQYQECPSIKSFLDKRINAALDKNALLSYLDNGFIVASTSLASFPSPFTGETQNGSVSFRTDGEWLWLDNISVFIKYNNLIIPDIFYNHMKKNSFLIPNIDEDEFDIMTLDWPKL